MVSIDFRPLLVCSLPYQRIVDNMRYENAEESVELGLGIVLYER